jgi:hypothetical protein
LYWNLELKDFYYNNLYLKIIYLNITIFKFIMTYNPNSINLFNLNLSDEECIICKESLNKEDIYI